MVREYEFTLISSSQMQDTDHAKMVEKYEKIITGEGGEILKKDEWGTKKFAYNINGHYRGNYTFYDLLATPEGFAEAERLMKIDSNILRWLKVKIGENVDPAERKAEIARKEVEAEAKKNRD